MNSIVRSGLAFSLLVAAAACSDGSGAKEAAPQPAKPIDAGRFYTGRWYEIGRTPMSLTNGCVAGTTDYYKDAKGQIVDRDACRQTTPEGKEKVLAGPVQFLDAGNTKISVGYKVFAVFTAKKTYWMLDHGDDYQWFIVSDPSFKMLSLFTRAPRPSKEEVKSLTERAAALGYNTAKLEFPAQFPPGEGEPTPH